MVKAIAFYLPQYHPVKENNEWWGEGFTEWRNVAKAVPNFKGHYQPHVPSDLGFYDLRLVEVQKKQAELARAHGLHGFCYYHYWFNGRRILERPFEQLLQHPEVDFPFCLCWANENWTRRWDGADKHILLEQNHSPRDDEAFIRALLPAFKDPRYIRVDGKPILLVYRVDLFPDSRRTAALWRRIAVESGLPGLHLCAVQFYGITEPGVFGFDAAVEFPPHTFMAPENTPDEQPEAINRHFRGHVFDYPKVVCHAIQKEAPSYRLYRGVMPSWDNTARRQDTPHIFIHASPLDYQYWLRQMVEQTEQRHEEEHQLLFINAWNEWGEGNHLEPDVKYGRAYLKATRSALTGSTNAEDLLDGLRKSVQIDDESAYDVAHALDARERSLFALQEVIRKKNAELHAQRTRLEQLAQPRQFIRALAASKLRQLPFLKETVKKLLE